MQRKQGEEVGSGEGEEGEAREREEAREKERAEGIMEESKREGD